MAETTIRWQRKHLLGLEELSADEIRFVLDTADSFKEVSTRSVKKVPALRGRVMVNAFFEDSTRTRTSFALAAQRLSADVIDFSEKTSSTNKGETLIDTARTIEAMGIDILVIRHSAAGAAQMLARHLKCSIVNAGDGAQPFGGFSEAIANCSGRTVHGGRAGDPEIQDVMRINARIDAPEVGDGADHQSGRGC